MHFVPTTYFTILVQGDEETDTYGDPVDNTTTGATGVPGHLHEASKQAFHPVDGRLTTVRFQAALVPASTSVSKGDNIKDENTNEIYFVEHVQDVKNFVHNHWPQRLELKRVE